MIAAQAEVNQMTPTQEVCKMQDIFCFRGTRRHHYWQDAHQPLQRVPRQIIQKHAVCLCYIHIQS
jgi:hypothetical protein